MTTNNKTAVRLNHIDRTFFKLLLYPPAILYFNVFLHSMNDHFLLMHYMEQIESIARMLLTMPVVCRM